MITDQKVAPSKFARGKKWLIFLGVLLAALFVMSRFATKTNVAQTDESDADARLHPRVYQAPPQKVAWEIRALAPQLSTLGKSWKLKDASTRGAAKLDLEVPVLMFTDDLTATLAAQNGGASTRVKVRSASRVGKGDFGENRRHIIQFLTALDERLK